MNTYTHTCTLPQESFGPLFPWWSLTWNQLDREASSIFQLSVFWNLHSFPISQGPPRPPSPPEPQSFFIYIFPCELPWWHAHYCMYFCDFSRAVQNFSVVLALPKMNPWLCVGAVRGGSGPWRRGQRGSCQWVLAVAGRLSRGWEKVCQELIEFVLPPLTLGPVAYQATSPGALQTDLPLPGHLISPSPCLQMSTPTSATHPFPSTYPVWSGSKEVTFWDEVSKCYKIVFLASGGLESEKDIRTLLPVWVEPLAWVCGVRLRFYTWNREKAVVTQRTVEDVSIHLKWTGSSQQECLQIGSIRSWTHCVLTTVSSNVQSLACRQGKCRDVIERGLLGSRLASRGTVSARDELPDH